MGDRDTTQGQANNNAPLREIADIKKPLSGKTGEKVPPNQQQEPEKVPNVKRNDNKRPAKAQVDDTNVVDMPVLPPREYNLNLIDEFLDVVFGAAGLDGEEILTWSVKPGWTPSYPISDEQLLKKLKQNPKALYFGTSTCQRNDMGELRNQKGLFTRLVVVVLDDIGTKVPFSKIPKKAVPTYKLETSRGNFQYGYVLSEQVTDLLAAEALIQIIYTAGFSDEGGKMPTKIVRLPEGVHGKVGAGQGFVTKLHNMDGPYWTPQELLDVLELDVKWSDVLTDAEDALKRHNPRGIGTSPWSGVPAMIPTLSGVIDPVLEWLYSEGRVTQDNGEWVTIMCPWAYAHTSGTNLASYSPVGRGAYPQNRGFNCFHEHCVTNKGPEFLADVVASGGPQAGVYDPVAQLTCDWAYDPVNDCAWHVTAPSAMDNVSISSFRNLYPQAIKVMKPDGKETNIKHAQMWLNSPSRATVFGQTFDPATPARIVEVGGKNRVNTYHPPNWPDVNIDQRHIDKFLHFIEYLLPIEEEREFFLNWLAAKADSMAFRGCAILMIAPTQGTGRGTLTDMLATMFSPHNVESLPFDKMIGDNTYNDWMEKPLVITDETLNVGENNRYRVYERLKELIDPRPKTVRINPKYGKQRSSRVHCSYIMMSNHEDALHIPDNDRRIYVIRNVITPASPEYFMELDTWINERDENETPCWAPHVWKWFKKRPYDLTALLAPSPMSAGKQAMKTSTESPLDQLVRLVLEYTPSEYVTPPAIEDVARALAERLDLYDMTDWKKTIRHIVKAKTISMRDVMARYNNSNCRVRFIKEKAGADAVLPTDKMNSEQKRVMVAKLVLFDLPKAIQYVEENLIL